MLQVCKIQPQNTFIQEQTDKSSTEVFGERVFETKFQAPGKTSAECFMKKNYWTEDPAEIHRF